MKISRTLVGAACAATMAVGGSAAMAGTASAYGHSYGGVTSSGQFLNDQTGQIYNYWNYVDTRTQYNRDHVCAGGKDRSRVARGGSACSNGGNFQLVHVAITVETQAYAAWVGDGGAIAVQGHATTE